MIGALVAKMKARAGFDALSRHDFDTFLAVWAEDAVFVYPGNLPVSGEIKGKHAVKEWFGKFAEQFPVSDFTVKNICVDNIFALSGTNVIAVHWDVKLRNRDGGEFQNSGVTVLTLKGAKAVLVRDFMFDTEVAKQAWGEAGRD